MIFRTFPNFLMSLENSSIRFEGKQFVQNPSRPLPKETCNFTSCGSWPYLRKKLKVCLKICQKSSVNFHHVWHLTNKRTPLNPIIHPICAISSFFQGDRRRLTTCNVQSLNQRDIESIWVLSQCCSTGPLQFSKRSSIRSRHIPFQQHLHQQLRRSSSSSHLHLINYLWP